ncbi:MAG: ABC transporter permease [Chitinophagaceae bacterium]|nr:MAG: ABC transporter permease [Chitinophagaceae bacterium]
MDKILKYVLYDIVRNRIVVGYTLFLLVASMGLFALESDPSKAVLSLLNVILLTVPLISIIFATIHFYNSYEFMELLVSQPIKRSQIFLSEYMGTALSLSMAFLVGVGLPLMLNSPDFTTVSLLLVCVCLTFIFTSLAFLASVITRDKAKGIGIALLLWFYFALLYDGLVMFVLFFFSDYPLEQASLAMITLNPIDLGRIIVLLNIDISALMGYTGALYKSFFDNASGLLYAFGLMLVWIFVPLWIAQRIFNKKDL